MDGDVRLQRDRMKLIDHVALDQAVRSPVVGKADGVDLLPIEVEDGTRSETSALQWILPRLVEMVTQSVLSIPSRPARD